MIFIDDAGFKNLFIFSGWRINKNTFESFGGSEINGVPDS